MSICEPCTDEGIQAEEEDLDVSPIEDLANKYLDEGGGEEENHSNDHVIPDEAMPEPKEEEQEPDDKNPEPVEQVWTNLFPSVMKSGLLCTFTTNLLYKSWK